MTGVEFDLFHSLFQCAFSIEIVEQLLVTHRVKCVKATIGVELPSFVDESLREHDLHTTVDAVVELLLVPQKGILHNCKVPGNCFLHSERGEGLAGLVADLQSTLQPAGVFLVHNNPIFGIKSLNLIL